MSGFIERGLNTNYCVLSQQLACAARAERIVQDELREIEMIEIDFHSEAKRLERSNLFECFVELCSVGPESLVTKRVVTKDLPSLFFQFGRDRGFRNSSAA